jgi:hypothetical protein
MIKEYIISIAIIAIIITSVILAPSFSLALPNREGKPGACNDTGRHSGPNGLMVVKCCWSETVKPGTGAGGTNKEFYCQECEDGGTRGYINCGDPELQYRNGGKPLPPLSGTINNGQISDDSLTSNNDNPNSGIGPKGGLAGGFDDIQSNNNNIIQSTPDSDADESTTVTTNTPQDRTSNVQTENASESSPN